MLRAVGIGVLVSAMTVLILLLLSALVFKIAGTISPVTAGVAGVLIAALSRYLGGYTATRILKRAGLLTGFLTALFASLLLFITGLLLSDNGVQPTNLIKHGILLFSGVCGGVLGVNHREKRK